MNEADLRSLGVSEPQHTEHDYPVADVRGEMPDELRRNALPQRPRPLAGPHRPAPAPPLRRRRHGLRLHHRWRHGALPQPLRAHPALPGQVGHPAHGHRRHPADSWPTSAGCRPNLANTNVIEHAGHLYALWEGGPPHELDPDTLETRGLRRFGGELRWIGFVFRAPVPLSQQRRHVQLRCRVHPDPAPAGVPDRPAGQAQALPIGVPAVRGDGARLRDHRALSGLPDLTDHPGRNPDRSGAQVIRRRHEIPSRTRQFLHPDPARRRRDPAHRARRDHAVPPQQRLRRPRRRRRRRHHLPRRRTAGVHRAVPDQPAGQGDLGVHPVPDHRRRAG